MANIGFNVIVGLLFLVTFFVIYSILTMKVVEEKEEKEEEDIKEKRFLLLKTIEPSMNIIVNNNLLTMDEIVEVPYAINLLDDIFNKSLVRDSETKKEGLLVTDVIRVSGKNFRDISNLNRSFEYIDDYIKIDNADSLRKDLMFPDDPAQKSLSIYADTCSIQWNIIHKFYVKHLYKNSLLRKYKENMLVMKGIDISTIPTIFKEILSTVFDFQNINTIEEKLSIDFKVESMLNKGYIILTNKIID